jgi:FkbM family methyltransferase
MSLSQALPLPLKLAVARQLAKTGPLLGRVFRNRIPILSAGFRLDTSSPLVDDATRAALFFHTYESSERRAIHRFLKSDRPELGASIGFISLLIARAAHPVKQIAIEANPDLLSLLRRNLALNAASAVEVVHAAVAYGGVESVGFAVAGGNVGGHIARSGVGNADVRLVPTITLQQILEQHQIREFTLVADIEGGEWDLIECEPQSTRERCQQAIFELHEIERDGRRISPKDMAARMRETWGMRVAFSDTKVWVFER